MVLVAARVDVHAGTLVITTDRTFAVPLELSSAPSTTSTLCAARVCMDSCVLAQCTKIFSFSARVDGTDCGAEAATLLSEFLDVPCRLMRLVCNQ